MTVTSRDWEHDFDFDDPEFHASYYEILRELAAKCPVAHSSAGDGYTAMMSYEAVTTVMRDAETFQSGPGFIINRPDGIPKMLPIEMDDPRHRAWRVALNPYFGPAAVRQWEDVTRELASSLVDGFAADGRCEFVGDFSGPFPAMLISRQILHFPEEDIPELRHNIHLGVFGIVNPDGSREFDPAGFVGVLQNARALLERRSNEPPVDDIIDAILTFEVTEGEPVTMDERAQILYTLIFAGLDTTTSTLAGAMFHLAGDRELYARLCADRSLIPAAIEEFLRYYTPGTCFARFASQDTQVLGVDIKAGDQVAIFMAAANLDPKEFGDPQIDIDREVNRHISFGFGPHRCLGSHLARMTLRVALDVLLDRLPNFRVDESETMEVATNQRRQTLRLPLSFDVSGTSS
ncbi:MAG: cytochrome P450 [Actinomycetota bacterium]|nr:cytochrome P450 [Actinomycetota bacterium]